MYRTVDSGMWGDPWFEDLAPDAKLLFIYLFTNARTNAAGAYEITLRTMAHETGLPADRVAECLGELSGRVVWWDDLRVVWVRNFHRRQQSNDKFRIAAARIIAALPAAVARAVLGEYPELAALVETDDRPSPRDSDQADTHHISTGVGIHTHTNQRTETGTETDQQQKQQQEQRQKSDARPRARAAAPPVASEPFALVEALCEAQGEDVSVLSRQDVSKQCAAGKRLAEGGATPADVRRIVGWLRSQSWVEGGVDLFLVEKQIGKWRLAGKPDATTAKRAAPNGRASPAQEAAERRLAAALDITRNGLPRSDQP